MMSTRPLCLAPSLTRFGVHLIALAAATLARADETNMLAVRSGEVLELPTDGLVQLADEGAIEFWYRHQTDQQSRRAFTEREFTEEAYSVVLTAGRGAELAFAVIVGPGTRDDQASIGVLSDLSTLLDRNALAPRIQRLTQRDDFGQRAGIAFVKGSTHHILIAKKKGRPGLQVYVDGRLQGSLSAEFGDTRGKPLCLGLAPAAFAVASEANKGEAVQPPLFPFEGAIGGLRVWRSGDFEESAVTRLAKFGRLVELADLTTLPEYGSLVAYGDFVGERWSPTGLQRVRDAAPTLHFADPLAGAWYPEGATVAQKRTDASVFEDYPIFTFIPATATPLPARLADRAYHVFEDSNFVGRLDAPTQGAAERWTFRHADGWRPQSVEHTALGVERKLRWNLSGMPTAAVFAGARADEVVLKRRNIAELGISSPSAARLTPQEAAELNRDNDFTLVFLYTAYPKFFAQLYGSYNIARMDPWNLFETGVRTDRSVLRAPTADQMFLLDRSEQMIMPYDLEVLQSQLSLDNSTSKLVSSARDYNSAVTSRVGAGVSGSVTVGTGAASPVSASGTVNLSVVVQGETMRELAGQNSESSEKILRSRWDKKYTLVHRKDLIRLSDAYQDSLRALQTSCTGASPDEWRRLTFAFFDTWGTHYPFATVFGSLELTETTVDDEMRMASASNQGSFEVTVNEGKTGTTESSKTGSTTSLKTGSTVVRAFGNEREPVPIAVDLRPLHDLLTPQHFPHEPELYIELRHLLGGLLNDYRAQRVNDTIDQLPASQRAKALSALKALDDAAPDATSLKTLAIRYTGLSARHQPSGPFSPLPVIAQTIGAPIDLSFDGTVDFIPAVTRADGYYRKTNDHPVEPVRIDVPAPLRASADLFLALNSPVRVIDPIRPEDETRVLRYSENGVTVERMGAPQRRSMSIKVPAGALEDFVYVQVNSSFEVKGAMDPRWQPMVSASLGDKPAQGTSLEPWFLLRSELHRPEGVNPIVTTRTSSGTPFQAHFDDLYASWSNAGGIVWANEMPAVVTLSGPISANGAFPPIQTPTAVLKKSHRDSQNRKFAFKAPIDGEWRSGETVLPVRGAANVDLVHFVVRYEYALLPDFKDAVAGRPDLLPESTWGSFSPGAKVQEVDPLVHRSTRTLRTPPSAPLPASLAPVGVVLGTHRLRVLDKALELATRGFGTLEFMGVAPTQSWTFIERAPREWLIVSTIDGRVLSTERGLSCVEFRADVDEQLWLPEPLDGRPSTYRFRNKRSGQYVARQAKPEGFMGVISTNASAGTAYDVAFVIDPPLDLAPNSQLRRVGSIDVARGAALLDDLSLAIASRFQPLIEFEERAALAKLWQVYRASFDADGDGRVDALEARGRGNADWPYPITADSYGAAARVTLGLEGKGPSELRAALSSAWQDWQFVTFALVTERVFGFFDTDYDRALAPEECALLLASPTFAGRTFEELDTNTDGSWSLNELRASGMSIARSLPVIPAPAAVDTANDLADSRTGYEVKLVSVGPNKIGVIKEVRSATGLGLREAKALVDNAPSVLKTFDSKAAAQAFAKALTELEAVIEVKPL